MSESYRLIAEWGVVGAVLVVVLGASIGLVWWTLRSTAKAIREKDRELSRVNERRVESAERAVQSLTLVSGQLERVLDKLLEALPAGEDGEG